MLPVPQQKAAKDFFTALDITFCKKMKMQQAEQGKNFYDKYRRTSKEIFQHHNHTAVDDSRARRVPIVIRHLKNKKKTCVLKEECREMVC
jgi:hypothetical protein